MNDGIRYSEMLKELEGIVEALSGDDCPVDELEVLVKRASELLKALRERLASTEKAVSGMLEELEEQN